MEPKEISSRLIPRPLVVFTRLLEILVTTLYMYMSIGLQTFAAILRRAFCGGFVVGKIFAQVKLV